MSFVANGRGLDRVESQRFGTGSSAGRIIEDEPADAALDPPAHRQQGRCRERGDRPSGSGPAEPPSDRKRIRPSAMLAWFALVPWAALPEPYLSLLVYTFVLMIVVLVGFGAIRIFGRWVKGDTGSRSRPNADYASFRELYERGELSAAEYERIKDRLNRKLWTDLHVTPPTNQSPEEEPLTEIQVLDPITDLQPPPPPEVRTPPEPPANGASGS